MPVIHHETLPNGLQLVIEPIAGVKSLAMNLALPAGAAYEPEDALGLSAVLTEQMNRGAAGLSAREHSDALDRLGVQRDTSNDTRHIRLKAAMTSDMADEALPLLLNMALRPNLDDATFEPSRDLAIQALDSMLDEPQQHAVELLRTRHHPKPYNHSSLGHRDHLTAMTAQQVRDFADRCFVPGGAILALAGDIDLEHAHQQVLALTDSWTGQADEPPIAESGVGGYFNQPSESAQVHIALAFSTLPESAPQSILRHAATAVLSGGMSGRLFTEVREKRGLCYAVFASYHGGRDWGTVAGYAGTTPQRAQETLDVFVNELHRLSEGITQDEFQRAIVGMKSRLVMQGESTAARAGAIASDVYTLGRPRTLDELAEEVDGVTLDAINAFVRENPPGKITVVTLGPEALTPPDVLG